MRTVEDFFALVPELAPRLHGAKGEAFNNELVKFMEDSRFTHCVLSSLYKDCIGQVLFITDNPANDCGIVIVECFLTEGCFIFSTEASSTEYILNIVTSEGLLPLLMHLEDTTTHFAYSYYS